MAFKNSTHDCYYNNSWKNKNKSFSKFPSKDSSSKAKDSRPSTSNHKSPTKSSSKKCFKCLGYGHIAANCPSKRNMMINVNGEVVSEHESANSRSSTLPRSPSEYESESPHEGDLLVVRRCLVNFQNLLMKHEEKIFSYKVSH